MQFETRSDAEMRAVLRREKLDCKTRIDDAVGLTVGEQAFSIEVAWIKRVDDALRRFEHVGTRGEAALREECGIESGRGRVPAMRRLRHRPDVREQRPGT